MASTRAWGEETVAGGTTVPGGGSGSGGSSGGVRRCGGRQHTRSCNNNRHRRHRPRPPSSPCSQDTALPRCGGGAACRNTSDKLVRPRRVGACEGGEGRWARLTCRSRPGRQSQPQERAARTTRHKGWGQTAAPARLTLAGRPPRPPRSRRRRASTPSKKERSTVGCNDGVDAAAAVAATTTAPRGRRCVLRHPRPPRQGPLPTHRSRQRLPSTACARSLRGCPPPPCGARTGSVRGGRREQPPPPHPTRKTSRVETRSRHAVETRPTQTQGRPGAEGCSSGVTVVPSPPRPLPPCASSSRRTPCTVAR